MWWCRPAVPTLGQLRYKDEGLKVRPGCVVRLYVQKRNEQRKLHKPVNFAIVQKA